MKFPFLYKKVGPTIHKVKADLPNFYPIEPISLPEMIQKMGDCLQLENIARWRTDRLWVNMSDWESETFTDEGVIRRHAKRGWVTDFGSIPAILESLQKRDDRDALIGFFNHDIDFGTNDVSFSVSNCLLHQTVEYAAALRGDYVPFKAWRIWRAVQSEIGYRVYNDSEQNCDYEKKWASVVWDAK